MLSCIWDRLASRSYGMTFVISCIIFPCAAIFYFYFQIFFFAWKSKGKTKQMNLGQSVRIAKGLFASFMMFALCWVPYGFIVMTDFEDKLPRSAIMFTMTIAHLNSALNPILYWIFNTNFRRGYINLFRKIIGLTPQVSSTAGNTASFANSRI